MQKLTGKIRWDVSTFVYRDVEDEWEHPEHWELYDTITLPIPLFVEAIVRAPLPVNKGS